MDVEWLESQLSQLGRRPSRRCVCSVGRRLRYHHPAAHPKEGCSTLSADRWPAEPAGHDEVEPSSLRGIPTARFRSSPHDGHPGYQVQRGDRLTQKARATEVGIEEDNFEVRSGAGEHEPREPAATTQVEDPVTVQHEVDPITCRSERPQEPKGVLDMGSHLARTDKVELLGLA
jgi:hypothetical protein